MIPSIYAWRSPLSMHNYIDGRPTNRLRRSCGSAEPYQQEKLRARVNNILYMKYRLEVVII